MVVVEVLPLAELVVENLGIVDQTQNPIEHAVELLIINAVRPFKLPIEPGMSRFDVDVPDPLVENMQRKLDWNSAPLSVWATPPSVSLMTTDELIDETWKVI